MNPLLTILASTCLLLALSQQLIGAGAQAEVTSAAPTVTGESTTTKDVGDSSEEDKPKGVFCKEGFTGGKGLGGMKGDQKKPMGPNNRHEFNRMEQRPGFGQMKPGQGGMQTGGHRGPVGGFGGNHPTENKPQ